METEKRLIDANDLIEATYNEYSWLDTTDDFRALIQEQPTVDAVEVVHGEWIDGRPFVNSRWKVCSVCHQTAPEPHAGYNYCPNCGAKMDGGGSADAE